MLTGANSGIGLATLEAFIAAGAQVLAVDLKADAMGANCIPLTLDLDTDAAPAVIARHAAALGPIDVVVNCAGIGGSKALADSDDALIDRILGVNLRALMRVTRDLLPLMRRPGGSIVNVASVFGEVGRSGTAAYAASKGGVSQLTRQLCADLGPEGIRVNAVAPGVILTAMTREKIETDPEYRRTMIDGTPVQRIGAPEDVAEAILFLASDRARFISGQILAVDGGWLAVRGAP